MVKFWMYIWSAIATFSPLLANGYLNVFIGHKEVMKLMGLEADLFYVHEGSINTYAMHFTVPVPADIHSLEFSWKSLTAFPLAYAITIDYDEEQNVLAEPTLSIPSKGFVPQEVETFLVYIPCREDANATSQAPLTVNMFVRAPPRHNDTKLHFKRNKICIKGVQQESADQTPTAAQSPTAAQAPTQGHALLGAAACALGVVLALSLIVSAMYIRARKQIRQDSPHTSLTTAAYGSHQNVFIRLNTLGRPSSANSGSYATITSLSKYAEETKKSCNIFDRFRSSPTAYPYATALLPMCDQVNETIYSKPNSNCPSRISYYASSQPTQVYSMSTPKSSRGNASVFGSASNGGSSNDTKEKLRRIPNVQPGMLTYQQLLKEGTYGRIYVGKMGDSCEVLIKTVVDGASLTQVACLLKDASALIGVGHQNILAPILANTELPGPPEIAYAHPTKGNLKMYLKKSREMNSTISTRQLVEFSLHVTKGLAYLHALGIVHKDVATRNCYLDGDFYVKICDSALSRDLFPDDYHCLGDNENRPLKWMALESLQKNQYTAFSDTWSLGVCFWELITLAMTPFEEVDIFELTAYLGDGFRLSQPINCPDEFYTVMSCCWLTDPKQRPPFPQLLAYLYDFHEDLGKYI